MRVAQAGDGGASAGVKVFLSLLVNKIHAARAGGDRGSRKQGAMNDMAHESLRKNVQKI
jgi:hypothetical protein